MRMPAQILVCLQVHILCSVDAAQFTLIRSKLYFFKPLMMAK